MELYLRKAISLDKKIIFDMANEEETRRNSFSTKPILWEEHEAWYDGVMKSENVQIFVCMDFMKPVGQVRVNTLENGEGRISYTIEKESRGSGYGKKMLLLLEKEILKSHQRKEAEHADDAFILNAEVKETNLASVKTFLSLNYEEVTPENGEEGVRYFRKLLSVENNQQKKAKGNGLENEMDSKKLRRPEFEILRVLSMGMVIVLHYLSKGNLLNDFSSGSSTMFWILEAASLVCVNVYVLISGYFLVEGKFKLSKLVGIWCQVLFYSVGVTLVCMLTGLVNYKDYLDFYQLQFFCFPIMNGHYWFATAYILFYMFSPLLAVAAKNMNQKQLGLTIGLLLFPFCLVKSVLPIQLPIDDLGNSFVWFLILFLVAAYIRLYGLPIMKGKGKALLWYIGSVAGTLLSLGAFYILHEQTGAYQYGMTIPTGYNFVFVFTGSLSLFMLFKQLRFKNNAVVGYLVRIAPYTFGVYLLHEHLLLRYKWLEWLNVSEGYGGFRLLHILLSVILVFGVGVLIDFLRSILFKGIQKLIILGLKIYYAKRELFDYLIFGGLTTVVNWIVYVAFAYLFLAPLWDAGSTTNVMVASVVAWIVSVLFAYITNRKFVFHSKVTEAAALLKEFVSFVSARIFSFFLELLLMYVMVDRLQINDLISKFFIGFVVVASNYIFSKLWIFKDGKKSE